MADCETPFERRREVSLEGLRATMFEQGLLDHPNFPA